MTETMFQTSVSWAAV